MSCPQDGTAKMSKSAENDLSRINLTDPPEVIAKKIKACKTDAYDGLEVRSCHGARTLASCPDCAVGPRIKSRASCNPPNVMYPRRPIPAHLTALPHVLPPGLPSPPAPARG